MITLLSILVFPPKFLVPLPLYTLYFFGTLTLTCDSEFLKGWSCSLMTLVCLAVLFCDTSRLCVFGGVIEFYVTVFDGPLNTSIREGIYESELRCIILDTLASLSIAVFFW